MHKKVMLEFPTGNRCWGYATTEHSASSYGQPVIISEVTKKVYSAIDITFGGISIICSDAEVVDELRKSGYNPILRKRKAIVQSISLSPEQHELLNAAANKRNITIGKLITDIIDSYFNRDV